MEPIMGKAMRDYGIESSNSPRDQLDQKRMTRHAWLFEPITHLIFIELFSTDLYGSFLRSLFEGNHAKPNILCIQ